METMTAPLVHFADEQSLTIPSYAQDDDAGSETDSEPDYDYDQYPPLSCLIRPRDDDNNSDSGDSDDDERRELYTAQRERGYRGGEHDADCDANAFGANDGANSFGMIGIAYTADAAIEPVSPNQVFDMVQRELLATTTCATIRSPFDIDRFVFGMQDLQNSRSDEMVNIALTRAHAIIMVALLLNNGMLLDVEGVQRIILLVAIELQLDIGSGGYFSITQKDCEIACTGLAFSFVGWSQELSKCFNFPLKFEFEADDESSGTDSDDDDDDVPMPTPLSNVPLQVRQGMDCLRFNDVPMPTPLSDVRSEVRMGRYDLTGITNVDMTDAPVPVPLQFANPLGNEGQTDLHSMDREFVIVDMDVDQ
jgi:hypothetical protein